jgi:transcriptional regulator with XRE-family HTH domain
MKVQKLGEYIRNQRNGSHMSLRRLSTLAGVSLPYLSQIERGLRRPSAEIMQAIAKALRISANTLYVQAGILDEHPRPDVHAAVMGDPGLTERQKQALLSVYASFREETARRRAGRKGLPEADEPNGATSAGAITTVRPGTGSTRSRSTGRKRSSGRPETQAVPKPSPGSPSASRSPSFEPTKGGATR